MRDRRDLQGAFVPTSEVYVRDVPAHRVEQAKDVVTDLCWLLRLASMSGVVPFETEFEHHTRRWSVSGEFQEFRLPIDIQDGCAVEEFVHATWREYRRIKRSRQLAVAIDYLVFAESLDVPMEVKLLMGFTVLEHLKATYARKKRIPLIAGYYRERDAAGHANKKSRKIHFDELVRTMLSDVQMRTALRTIIPLRNRLIHTGITRNSVQRNFEIYGAVAHTIHRYLFRILGYRGPMIHHGSLKRVRA
jgi:hypothetical protein